MIVFRCVRVILDSSIALYRFRLDQGLRGFIDGSSDMPADDLEQPTTRSTLLLYVYRTGFPGHAPKVRCFITGYSFDKSDASKSRFTLLEVPPRLRS